MSQTNETTAKILDFLFSKGIFAWRENVAPIPIRRGGVAVASRPSTKAGMPDIVAILPPNGKFCGIEVKTGKDRMRPEQFGFKANTERMGAVYLVVHTFEDFLIQYSKIYARTEKITI